MALPRSGLATKGIVPFEHDLIKSFSPPDWIKDFKCGYLLRRYFFVVEMKDYITTSTLTTYYRLRKRPTIG